MRCEPAAAAALLAEFLAMRWPPTRPRLRASRAAATLQAAIRLHLLFRRRRLATVRIQRHFRRQRSAGTNLFVMRLQRHFVMLAAFSILGLVVFEAIVASVRSNAVQAVCTLFALPSLVSVVPEYRRLRRGVLDAQGHSPWLIGVVVCGLLRMLLMTARLAWDAEGFAAEARLADQFTTMRAIHCAVLLSVVPCHWRYRIAYGASMAVVSIVEAIISSSLLKDDLWVGMLRGPISVLVALGLASMLISASMLHTRLREEAMGDLRVTLDALGGSGRLNALVDFERIRRDWVEQGLSRFCAMVCLTSALVYFLTMLLWSRTTDGSEMAHEWFVTRAAAVVPIAIMVGLSIAMMHRSKRTTYYVLCAVGLLLYAVHLFQMMQKLRLILVLRASEMEALSLASGQHELTSEDGEECVYVDGPAELAGRANGTDTHTGALWELMLLEVLAACIAFLRGFLSTVLPLPPRIRAFGVALVALKQLVSFWHWAVLHVHNEAAIGRLMRDLSMAMFGVATVCCVPFLSTTLAPPLSLLVCHFRPSAPKPAFTFSCTPKTHRR